MQAYKVEVLIIDFEGHGAEEIRSLLENSRYLAPQVKSIEARDIGEWTDEHPLNKRATADATYKELFGS
jgi:hypothetical protein